MSVNTERRKNIPRRCAWCERFSVEGEWVRGRRETDEVQAHGWKMTHTICEECAAQLRANGKSV